MIFLKALGLNGKTWGGAKRCPDLDVFFSLWPDHEVDSSIALITCRSLYLHTQLSVFSPLRSIWVHQKHVNSHFWSLKFTCFQVCFQKRYNFFFKIMIFLDFLCFFLILWELNKGILIFVYFWKVVLHRVYGTWTPNIHNKWTFWIRFLGVFLRIHKKWFFLKVHDNVAKLR